MSCQGGGADKAVLVSVVIDSTSFLQLDADADGKIVGIGIGMGSRSLGLGEA